MTEGIRGVSAILGALLLAWAVVALPSRRWWSPRAELAVGLFGVLVFAIASTWGLAYVPGERYMSETGRLFFLHPPTAMNALLYGTVSLAIAVGSLVRSEDRWDQALVAAVEVSLLLMVILLLQGMIWGAHTWGTPWVWDPRLTTTAVMAIMFAGVLSLRSFATNPGQRSSWTAVSTIVAYLNVPIVYFVVDMAPGLHQARSNPETVSDQYRGPFLLNIIGLLFIGLALTLYRSRLARAEHEEAAAPEAGPVLVAGDG